MLLVSIYLLGEATANMSVKMPTIDATKRTMRTDIRNYVNAPGLNVSASTERSVICRASDSAIQHNTAASFSEFAPKRKRWDASCTQRRHGLVNTKNGCVQRTYSGSIGHAMHPESLPPAYPLSYLPTTRQKPC